MSDTAVLAGTPYGGESEHSSRSVRKIDNGYLTCSHESGPEGYVSKEYFTRDHPDHGPSIMDGNGSAMRKAVECLKK